MANFVQRDSPASYTDVNGIVQTAPPNVLRDNHYIGGILQPALIETRRTNTLKWSRDLTNAVWATSGVVVRAQTEVGLDGNPNTATRVTDNDATSAARAGIQTFTIPDSSEYHTARLWVLKDSDTTRNVGFLFRILTGAPNTQVTVHLNTSTGQAAQATPSGVTKWRVIDDGLWWIIEITLLNNSTGAVSMSVHIYPAIGTVLGTQSSATTGSATIGQVQVELGADSGSSPIFTTGAAVTREADIFAAATIRSGDERMDALLTFQRKHEPEPRSKPRVRKPSAEELAAKERERQIAARVQELSSAEAARVARAQKLWGNETPQSPLVRIPRSVPRQSGPKTIKLPKRR